MVPKITGHEMNAPELIELVAHRLFELNGVEEKDSVVVQPNGCCSIAYCDEFTIAEWREAVEWRGEGGDRWGDIADRQAIGRHARGFL